MRWKSFALVFCALFCSGYAESEDDQPYLHVMSKSILYNVGEKKAIYCNGTNLKEKLEWYNPAGQLVGRSKDNRVKIETTRNDPNYIFLIIKETEIGDSGNWTCKSGDLNETIEILVGERVNFATRYETYVGDENRSAKLDCIAKGNPTPVVQWYKDTVPIPDDPSKYVIRERDDNYQLEIKNLNHKDSGVYVCKVTQVALSYYTDKYVELSVQHKPLLVDYVTKEIYQHSSTYVTKEVYAVMNETKNITCFTISTPAAMFRWSKKKDSYDEPIPEEDMIFTEDRASTLMLRMYNESFLGEYKCTVTNNKGKESIVFHVTLGNKPEPPDFVSMINSTSSEILFNVTCSVCEFTENDVVAPDPSNLRIIAYSFRFAPVQEEYPIPNWDQAYEIEVEITDPEDTLFSVGPLPNATTFHAQVRSKNAAGHSAWVDISPDPFTTDVAFRGMASLLLIIATFLFTRCY